jgi:predicted kinase
VGQRQDVPSCKRHLREPLPAVAVVADTIRRTLARCPALNTEDQATLLRLLVEALETPL